MIAVKQTVQMLTMIMTLTVIVTLLYEITNISPEAQHIRLKRGNLTRKPCHIEALGSDQQFYKYFRKLEYKCENLMEFGARPNKKWLSKFVCLDQPFGIRRDNCTVISFGINYEWEFEDDMDNYGCVVHAFDPTMRQLDHKRSERTTFHRLGISNIKGKRNVGMGNDFSYLEVDRYENILRSLDLLNTRIDYLKLDVELSELEFLQDVLRNSPRLLQNIGQIGMEVHHGYKGEGLDEKPPRVGSLSPTSTFPLFWSYFQELRCHGFKLIHARPNVPWHEVVWARNDEW
ncbi:methyltransferase-like protein 24 isoform X1 [Homarus americanus]|uniref:Methyltransferase-like protein 24-like 2 n=1 Tax=Homarus americanus TaxID=6706 RepID=A0A8J5NF32_HOMAM|nr:methyltransferase-like protein 24 isoform X1 [Homarus americanus]XP_042234934.1 methyltransferase-like protein 24 isoform X1 [Homarus americanus]XP_042235007.1 methyltransferase-like protein 24 isoform X1 [Homarus americanus]KAG7178044.1 Methyltransferase-like protein 24-like 2 [Homarus americanus]